jgi:hypothetical protein
MAELDEAAERDAAAGHWLPINREGSDPATAASETVDAVCVDVARICPGQNVWRANLSVEYSARAGSHSLTPAAETGEPFAELGSSFSRTGQRASARLVS